MKTCPVCQYVYGGDRCPIDHNQPNVRDLGAVCPRPGVDACLDASPCSDCVSLSKWEPLEPYDIDDEPPGSPIFLPGGAA